MLDTDGREWMVAKKRNWDQGYQGIPECTHIIARVPLKTEASWSTELVQEACTAETQGRKKRGFKILT